jgi:hypothetical protein
MDRKLVAIEEFLFQFEMNFLEVTRIGLDSVLRYDEGLEEASCL